MADGQVTSKAALLEMLRSTGQDFLTKGRALPVGEWSGGRYENGWTARQILAHVASIEWTYPRLFDVARQGRPAGGDKAPEPAASAPPTRIAQGGIDDYNARQVAKREGASVDELLAEFERNRQATIAAVQAADESLLRTPIRSARGVTGALADVVRAVAVEHVRMHLSDIVGERSRG